MAKCNRWKNIVIAQEGNENTDRERYKNQNKMAHICLSKHNRTAKGLLQIHSNKTEPTNIATTEHTQTTATHNASTERASSSNSRRNDNSTQQAAHTSFTPGLLHRTVETARSKRLKYPASYTNSN